MSTPPTPFNIADGQTSAHRRVIAPLAEYLDAGPGRRPKRASWPGIEAQSPRNSSSSAPATIRRSLDRRCAVTRRHTRGANQSFASDDFNFVQPRLGRRIHWDLNFFMTSAKVDEARADLRRRAAYKREAGSRLRLAAGRSGAPTRRHPSARRYQRDEEGRKAGRGLLILT